MAIGRGKKLINTPYYSPNDGQASPCLNSIPLKFLSSSLVPSYALYCLILSYTCTTIHRFLISPSVPASLGTCFSLSFPIQSWRNQPKYIHHFNLSPTISHHPLFVCCLECTPGASARPWTLAASKLKWKFTFFPDPHLGYIYHSILFVVRANAIIYKFARAK